MPDYIADSYTRAEPLVREISDQVASLVTRAERNVADLQKVSAGLGQLADPFQQGGYLETVQFIKNRVNANPQDEAWRALDKRLDKIIADYRAAKAKVDNILDAISRA